MSRRLRRRPDGVPEDAALLADEYSFRGNILVRDVFRDGFASRRCGDRRRLGDRFGLAA